MTWACPICGHPDLARASGMVLPVNPELGHDQDDNPKGMIILCHSCFAFYIQAAWTDTGHEGKPVAPFFPGLWRRQVPGHEHNARLITAARALWVTAGSPSGRVFADRNLEQKKLEARLASVGAPGEIPPKPARIKKLPQPALQADGGVDWGEFLNEAFKEKEEIK
jgi:hypothetical protein